MSREKYTITLLSGELSSKIKHGIEDLKNAIDIVILEVGPKPKAPRIVAQIRNTVVGCLWVTPEAPFDLDIGVGPEFRRQGIARAMLLRWADSFPEETSSIDLAVSVTNETMKGVLKEAGLDPDDYENYRGEVTRARFRQAIEVSLQPPTEASGDSQ